MKKKKKKEEKYEITFLGLLSLKMELSLAEEVQESIELFLRRRKDNAIILDEKENKFIFAHVGKSKK